MIADFHPEDIKASIRKKYKSLNAFERAHGLPFKSVSAFLRGNPSRPVRTVIEAHLRAVISPLGQADISAGSSTGRPSHRLNQEAA